MFWVFPFWASWLFLTLVEKANQAERGRGLQWHQDKQGTLENVRMREWAGQPATLRTAPAENLVFMSSVIWRPRGLALYPATPSSSVVHHSSAVSHLAHIDFPIISRIIVLATLCLSSLSLRVRGERASVRRDCGTDHNTHCPRSKAEEECHCPKQGGPRGPWPHVTRGEPSTKPQGGQAWQAPRLLTAKALWQNILESWGLVKNMTSGSHFKGIESLCWLNLAYPRCSSSLKPKCQGSGSW